MERKRHSKKEVSALLLHADQLAAQGKLQKDIAGALGVSVMTLHRWRKARGSKHSGAIGKSNAEAVRLEADTDALIQELERENARLRVLVTDLLLEKSRLEDALQLPNVARGRRLLSRRAKV